MPTGRRIGLGLLVMLLVAVGAGAVATRAKVGGSTASAAGSGAPATVSLLSGAVPSSRTVSTDRRSVELGLAFSLTAGGDLVGLRYYRAAGDAVAHDGSLWSGEGRLLTSVRFPATDINGWQYAAFTTPFAASAGRYVASYHTTSGYAADSHFFSAPRTQGPLAAGTSAGVFGYGRERLFPRESFDQSNYWIDPVFVADGSPAAPAESPSPTPTPTPTETPAPVADPAGWPDKNTTGVTGCPPLQRVEGPEVVLRDDGMVYQNKEVHDAVIRVLAHHVTIRCVKIVGIGWYGIDNTERRSPAGTSTDVVVDRVEVDCRDKGFVVGLLLQAATVTRANVHNCDHMINAGGDNLVVQDSFCHDMTQIPGKDVHADCIQSLGGNKNLTIRHNALWGWDTSDVLLGEEYGEASNVLIEHNRFMSDPDQSPPPAYLLYLSGTNTVVKDNHFTRRYTYGPCTLNVAASHITWSGNVWDDDGSPVKLSHC